MQTTTPLSLLAVALLVAAPTALAGTEDEPEVVDPALDAMPPPMNAYADITKAWFEAPDDATLRLHLELSFMPPDDQPGVAYGLLFEAGNASWYGAYISLPFAGFFVGPWDDGQPGDLIEAEGTMARGPGARIAIDFPRAILGPNTTEVGSPRAVTADIKLAALPLGLNEGVVYFDEGASDAAFVLPSAQEAPEEGDAAAPVATLAADEAAEVAPQPARAEVPPPGPGALAAVLALVALARARRR